LEKPRHFAEDDSSNPLENLRENLIEPRGNIQFIFDLEFSAGANRLFWDIYQGITRILISSSALP